MLRPGLPVYFTEPARGRSFLTAFMARGRCQIINNGIDLATEEAILAQLSPVPLNPGKPRIAIVAHDLRYDGSSQRLVHDMMALGEKR